jgi:ParB-like nuclease domain
MTPRHSWRELYPVHPCADVFPMLADAELDELAKNIDKHGLQSRVVLWRANPENRYVVLDGRNRLEAWVRLGRAVPSDAVADGAEKLFTFANWSVDPAAFVISANIHRRHLTKQEQAELIVMTIEAGQNDSAKVARSFSPQSGARGGSTKDAVLTAAIEEGKKHDLSKRTIERARKVVRGGVTKKKARSLRVDEKQQRRDAKEARYQARLEADRKAKREQLLAAGTRVRFTLELIADAQAPRLSGQPGTTLADKLAAYLRRQLDWDTTHGVIAVAAMDEVITVSPAAGIRKARGGQKNAAAKGGA